MPHSTSETRMVYMAVDGTIIKSKVVSRWNNPNIDNEGRIYKDFQKEINRLVDAGKTIPCVNNYKTFGIVPDARSAQRPWLFNQDRDIALRAAVKCHSCPLFDMCAKYRDSIQWPEGVFAGVWCFPAPNHRISKDFRHNCAKGYEHHIREYLPFISCHCQDYAHEIKDHDTTSHDEFTWKWNSIDHGSEKGRDQHKNRNLPMVKDGVPCECVNTPSLYQRRKSKKRKVTQKA